MVYILLVFAHVGAYGSGNSNSVITQEFNKQETCLEAKKVFESMSAGTTKIIKAECVKK